ncbi:MAG: hypothetical protein R6W48_05460 [Gaiellaceae bacterium]
MALRRLRPFGALIVLALLALAAGAGAETRLASPTFATAASANAFAAQPSGAFSSARLAQTAVTWRGGRITASTGEAFRVFVSDSLPVETSMPESWAEFLAGLTHGPELSLLTAYIATLAEVQQICGARALGCYGRNQMIAPGDATFDGASAEEVVRHEYGHHVAFHRSNAPWVAIDWGPKRWASTAGVCARVARSEAYPGNQGTNYSQNPGEAWAEAYRLMDERKAGITTATWPIIAPSFYPSETALQAAEADVLQPWTSPSTSSFQRVFVQRTPRVWWIPLSTPLDGELRLSVTLPRNGTHEVALVAANRRTVIRRGQWVGQRAKRLTTTVCGQRNLFIRVTQSGALGRVAVTATRP